MPYEIQPTFLVEALWLAVALLLFMLGLAALRRSDTRVGRAGYRRPVGNTGGPDRGRDPLADALDDVSWLNEFDPHSERIRGVQLDDLVRYRPATYRSAVSDIARAHREGKVLSVDLAPLETFQAARIVDFCSGLAKGSSGWIFRVTDTVILINPR
ncbi:MULTISPECIES: cell division protein SepF [Actinomadura]|uniref:Cell division protein SepF n=1 Tax=Actinomadura yumaensis TaxID=111807 RepID=A0ABW2CDH4_9ACTN|nr:cell division protein SepF [Actinomadura sp. J1-007]MWK35829.1 DUF552 domain-containing protein [Actinomadura sp. J1-007]